MLSIKSSLLDPTNAGDIQNFNNLLVDYETLLFMREEKKTDTAKESINKAKDDMEKLKSVIGGPEMKFKRTTPLSGDFTKKNIKDLYKDYVSGR